MPPVFRRAARLLVLDGARRVLLFRHAPEGREPVWATPGGGLEPGESFEDAARRESVEELGAPVHALTPAWEMVQHVTIGGRELVQHEQFFVVEVAGPETTPGSRASHAAEAVDRIRYWSVEELSATRETVRPADLADHLMALPASHGDSR